MKKSGEQQGERKKKKGRRAWPFSRSLSFIARRVRVMEHVPRDNDVEMKGNE